VHVHANAWALAGCTALFAWLCYGFINVNYALFSVTITGYIVFLLSLNQVPGPLVAERRTLCTLIGGGIALCVRLIVISRSHERWRKAALAVRGV
jgi:uncharacterized membrane protein YccC